MHYKQLNDKEWLEKRYLDDLMTMDQIAAELGCNKTTVSRVLKRHGIDARPHTSKYPLLNDKDWLRQTYIEEGKSTHEIAKITGSTPGNVISHLNTADIPTRTSAEGLHLKFPDGRTMEDHPHWKGGKRVSRSGYVWRYVPDHPKASGHGYVQEHRLVAEAKIGRLLEANEIVHHIDGNKKNNDPENLIVMSRGDHMRLHYQSYKEVQKLKEENVRLRRELDDCRKAQT